MTTLFDKVFYKCNEQKIAIIDEGQKINYKKFFEDCLRVYSFLKSYGRKKKICICLPNCYHSVLIFLAASKSSFLIFPISDSISNKKLKEYSKKYKFDLIISEKKMSFLKNQITLEKLKKDLNKIKAINLKCVNADVHDRDYIVLLSSGSTGNPKPILLTQKNKYLRSFFAGQTYKLKNNEVFIQPYGLDHSIGQRIMFMSLIHSGTLIILKNFTSENWYNNVSKNKVTFSLLVSFHIKNILSNKLDLFKLKSVKNIVSVSDILEDEVRKKILKYKFKFHEIYGTTEVSTVANISHRKNSRIRSVGKILSFADVKILKENNKFEDDGNIGEIVCRTPLMFKTYYKNIKETKENFTNGYFRTGDIGYIKNSYIFFKGRKKNIIKVSGLNIYPEDIEIIIKELPFVKDCIVLGHYHEMLGQEIAAQLCIYHNNKCVM